MTRFALVALLFASNAARAQDLAQDGQAWLLVSAEGRVRGPCLYFLETQPRASLDAGGPYQAIVRPALGFAFTKWFSLWGGAAWIPALGGDDLVSAGEGRFFQQMLLSGTFAGIGVTSRSRFEQRAFARGGDLSLRARTMLRATAPLAFDGALYAAVWDEVFGNMNSVDGGPARGFDQNRAFVGLGYKPAPYAAIEAGYLNRVTATRMDHTLFTWIAFRFY